MGRRKRRRIETVERASRLQQLGIALDVARAALDPPSVNTDLPVVLHPDEHVLAVVHDAGLVEGRRVASHSGTSQGITVPTVGRVRYRVGSFSGQSTTGPDRPQIVDIGVVTISDRRVSFQGSTHTREWELARVIGSSTGTLTASQ